MPSYAIDKKITSVFVSVTLLQELEKYILDVCETQRDANSHIKYTAIIYDKFAGEEEIDSFENYQHSTLPKDTQRISLKIHDYTHSFSITLNFSEGIYYSSLNIQATDDEAQEKVLAIVNRIETYLKEHKNINYIFYSKLMYIPWVLGALSAGITISEYRHNGLNDSVINGLFIVLVVSIVYILKRLSPFSTFDTKKNQTTTSARKWTLIGLAGVILFGAIAIIARKLL